MHDSTDDFDIVAGHRMTVNDKLRMVNCIRDAHEPVEYCPLCSAGKKLEYRLYIHLIEYVKNDQGKIVPVPRVWERSASYVNTLTNLIKEYGPLSENIFKITRNGEKGSKSTTYDIMYGNPRVYSQELYPMKPDAFANYRAVGNMVLDYDYDKLVALVGGTVEEATPRVVTSTATTPTQTTTSPYTTTSSNIEEARAQMEEVPAPPRYNVQSTTTTTTTTADSSNVVRPTRRFY
jgi:hypothetical protein